MKLTTIILTFNEERNIAACIRTVDPVSDEVLIVDSGSTDSTTEIANGLGCRVLVNAFNGYSEQRNFALSIVPEGWVLMIDADERLDDQLERSIRNLLCDSKGGEPYKVYKIPRKNYLWGRWLKHSTYPDYQVRLFQVGQGFFYKNLLHEELEVGLAEIGNLDGALLHYQNADVGKIIEKLNRYTVFEAIEIINRQESFLSIKLIYQPIRRFISGYFIKLGVMDGWRGLIWVGLTSIYEFVKYAKAIELNRSENG